MINQYKENKPLKNNKRKFFNLVDTKKLTIGYKKNKTILE